MHDSMEPTNPDILNSGLFGSSSGTVLGTCTKGSMVEQCGSAVPQWQFQLEWVKATNNQLQIESQVRLNKN